MIRFHYSSTKDSDMLYALQQPISDAVFLLDIDDTKRVFLNVLDIDAFREKNTDAHLEVVPVGAFSDQSKNLSSSGRLAHCALAILRHYGVDKETITVSRHMPLDIADVLRAEGVLLAVTPSLYPERAIKRAEEISYIEENLALTTKAFARLEEILEASHINGDEVIFENNVLTCEFLKKEVDRLFFNVGLQSSEGLIIASGEQAAYPHHTGSGVVHANQTLICDLYPRHVRNHYFADMTRAYVKGEPSEQVQKMYDAVFKAKEQSIAAIRPGVAVREVYEISADVIRTAGFDVGETGYVHGLGHGLGLDVHEAPNVSQRSEEHFAENMVLTVEPGLYYPQWGGVRLEDVVVVTRDGCRNLTNYPSELLV